MARPGITYQQVANLAVELVASDLQPTIERIRQQLKTGSHSTIGKYLREWRIQQQQPLQASKDNLPEELVAMLKGLWERIMQQAQDKIDAVSQTYEQELVQQGDIIQALQQDKATLERSENELKLDRENLNKDKMNLEQALAQARTQIVCLQTKEEGLLQQLADKQIHIDTLKEQHEQTQVNFEHYQAAVLEQRQHERLQTEKQQQVLNHTILQLQQENELLKQQKFELQGSHEQLTLAQTGLQAEIAKYREAVQQLSDASLEANKKLAQQIISSEHWQNQHQVLSNRYDELMQTNINLNAQNAVLVEKLAACQAHLDQLAEHNKVLNHDKWVLAQEKAKLNGQLLQRQEFLFEKNTLSSDD